MRRLTVDLPEVNLAVSLHAPNQEMRTSIVPTAKRYPIEDLIDALDKHMMTFVPKQRHTSTSNENPQNGEYTEHEINGTYTVEERTRESTRRRAMVEYVMLEGPTTSIEAAHQLGKLCEGRQLVVNLIPYNQTDVKDQLCCPGEDQMQEFRKIVASYGSFCTIRRTMGADIDSACGQLVTFENRRKVRRSADIEDVGTLLLAKKVPSSHDDILIFQNTSQPTKRRSTTSSQAVDSGSLEGKADLEPWINLLVFATTVSAVCFVATTCLYLQRGRQ